MRVLVTGSGGFVGRHLCEYLRSVGDDVAEWSGALGSPDISERDAVHAAMQPSQFDGVYHLAGQARVDLSWSEPSQTLAVNAGGTANLMDALEASGSPARVLVMSSAEVYGTVASGTMPLSESAALAPRTPYGVSKVAAEQVAEVLAEAHKREVVVCRPFNQIGPGQAATFVTPSFAQQVAANERAGGGEIRVGNLSATRDFLDVRDAVVAYRRLMLDGVPGEAYNVASGEELAVQALLEGLIAASSAAQSIVVDEDRFRPNDVPRMYGSVDKLVSATGWTRKYSIKQTLADVLDEARARETR